MARYSAVGNTTAPAELRFLPNGTAVCNFTVAETVQKYDKQQNAWVDDYTNFWPCAVWGKDAENAAESLDAKGIRVVVVGDLKTRSWETKDGDKRSRQELDRCEVGVSAKFDVVTRAPRGSARQQSSGFGAPSGDQFGGQQGGFSRAGFDNTGLNSQPDDNQPPF